MKKFLIAFMLLVPLVCFGVSPMKVNSARLLLAKLRGGDYAHAGDKEAVDLVVQKVVQMSPEIKKASCLDVGSGFGGSANDFYQMGFHSIWGIDIDTAAVAYAQEHYPQIDFICADAKEVKAHFHSDFFSFIYLLNVAYAIEDKQELFKNLSLVAKPGALLALFDYTSQNSTLPVRDLADKLMYPMNLTKLKEDLSFSGWEMLETIDLSEQFKEWYRCLLHKLSKEQSKLELDFSKEDIARVNSTFKLLLKYLESGRLGGALIFARKNG